MYGIGLVRGMGITIKHFVATYVEDLRWFGRRYYNPEAFAVRQSSEAQGIFTVQYPEEKLITPEEFRYIPFLIYDELEDGDTPGSLYFLRHMRQGMPTAMHLDRAFRRSRNRSPDPGAN